MNKKYFPVDKAPPVVDSLKFEITASPLPVTVTIAAPSMRSLGSSRLSTILSRSEICDPAEVLLFFLI